MEPNEDSPDYAPQREVKEASNKPHYKCKKNNRELEHIILECILLTIRESIPTEEIIRAYMDETTEQEEIVIEGIPDKETNQFDVVVST